MRLLTVILTSLVVGFYSLSSFSAMPPKITLKGKVVKFDKRLVYLRTPASKSLIKVPKKVFRMNKQKPRVGKTSIIRMDVKKFLKLH